MLAFPSVRSLERVFRYYQAGVVNTLFGYAAYAGLIFLGSNMYAAQALAHICGMAFNYFTYSRHVFRDTRGSKINFIVSYLANYLASVATLAAVSRLVASAYVAGLVTIVIVSILNYFVLKHFVFVEQRAQ
jgi:putative flippase GtrA